MATFRLAGLENAIGPRMTAPENAGTDADSLKGERISSDVFVRPSADIALRLG